MNQLPIKTQFDPDFFAERDQFGYHVTRERTEVWAVELDLLRQLDMICEKYGLQYCAGAGTLLGAVRHQGFIPWDDDVDVYMLRPQYDTLMEHADEFEDPYFLQIPQTEPKLGRGFAKLRNRLTFGANDGEMEDQICKGIFVDIFPLDGISDNAFRNKWQGVRNTWLKRAFGWYNYLCRGKRSGESLKFKLVHLPAAFLVFLFGRDNKRINRAFERNLSRYSRPETKMWGNRTIHFNSPRSRRPLAEWKDLKRVPFENTTILIPAAYDAMLRQQYGDYMRIPENKGGSLHGVLNVDPYHSAKPGKGARG